MSFPLPDSLNVDEAKRVLQELLRGRDLATVAGDYLVPADVRKFARAAGYPDPQELENVLTLLDTPDTDPVPADPDDMPALEESDDTQAVVGAFATNTPVGDPASVVNWLGVNYVPQQHAGELYLNELRRRVAQTDMPRVQRLAVKLTEGHEQLVQLLADDRAARANAAAIARLELELAELRRGQPSSTPTPRNPEAAQIRAWAAMRGLKVAPVGRIPAEIESAYRSATPNA